jgi:hypothetical protein
MSPLRKIQIIFYFIHTILDETCGFCVRKIIGYKFQSKELIKIWAILNTNKVRMKFDLDETID